MTEATRYDVIIAGGGPAGSSAAIHLAHNGARVLLAEQKKFPRPKLCGEFISPECYARTLNVWDVAERMLAGNPAELSETVFYSKNGAKVSVPSKWFSGGGIALGLSRAEMDERLLRKAIDVGVDVQEDVSVADLLLQDGRVNGVKLKHNGTEQTIAASITIDATGRTRALTRMFERAHSSKLVCNSDRW
jgi:flavin-dependent dehydrogenase